MRNIKELEAEEAIIAAVPTFDDQSLFSLPEGFT